MSRSFFRRICSELPSREAESQREKAVPSWENLVKWGNGRAERTAKREGRPARAKSPLARAGEGVARATRAKPKLAKASQGSARAVECGALANRGAEEESERAARLRQSECKQAEERRAPQEAQA